MTLPLLTSPSLTLPGIAHAFFTRQGGVSQGVYASLNGGVGSRDAPQAVAENRARMARALGVEPSRFLVPFQAHTADAVTVTEPWGERPRCDGIVTTAKRLALGVTGADCGVLLFADAQAGVIGAAHAGWKGAFTGVIAATVEAMVAQGARREVIVAALGPTIGARSYEVGPEFRERIVAEDARHDRFFAPSARVDHAMFDLPGFIAMRVAQAGVTRFADLALDTYADESRFFSYRRSVHRGEPDYGRLVAAIALV